MNALPPIPAPSLIASSQNATTGQAGQPSLPPIAAGTGTVVSGFAAGTDNHGTLTLLTPQGAVTVQPQTPIASGTPITVELTMNDAQSLTARLVTIGAGRSSPGPQPSASMPDDTIDTSALSRSASSVTSPAPSSPSSAASPAATFQARLITVSDPSPALLSALTPDLAKALRSAAVGGRLNVVIETITLPETESSDLPVGKSADPALPSSYNVSPSTSAAAAPRSSASSPLPNASSLSPGNEIENAAPEVVFSGLSSEESSEPISENTSPSRPMPNAPVPMASATAGGSNFPGSAAPPLALSPATVGPDIAPPPITAALPNTPLQASIPATAASPPNPLEAAVESLPPIPPPSLPVSLALPSAPALASASAASIPPEISEATIPPDGADATVNIPPSAPASASASTSASARPVTGTVAAAPLSFSEAPPITPMPNPVPPVMVSSNGSPAPLPAVSASLGGEPLPAATTSPPALPLPPAASQIVANSPSFPATATSVPAIEENLAVSASLPLAVSAGETPHSLPSLPPTAAANGTIAAVVIGSAGSDELVLQTPIGLLKLLDTPALATGSVLALRIQSIDPAESAGSVFTSSAAPSPMEQIAGALSEAAIAAPEIAASLPRPGKDLLSDILSLFSAVKAGDVKKLIGPLRAGGVHDASALGKFTEGLGAIAQNARLDAATQQWNQMMIPLLLPGYVDPVQLFWKDQSGSEDQGNPQDSQHFLIDMNLSQWGQLQFDGLVKKGSPLGFDLVIRSQGAIPAEDRQAIADIYRSIGESAGFRGSLQFRLGLGACMPLPNAPTSPISSQSVIV